MNDDELWEKYLIPGTDILKNNLNIENKEELKGIEKIITRKTLAKLYLEPVEGNFDTEHLKEIHRRIFKDIYPFAGEYRVCTMQKSSVFCNPEDISKILNEILIQMNRDFSNDIYSSSDFAFKLGKYYYDLIYVHPFREGNGRAIRAFIREFVLEKSKKLTCGPLDLDYTKIDGNNLMLGTVQRYLYPSLIEMEFMNGLVKLEKEKNVNAL